MWFGNEAVNQAKATVYAFQYNNAYVFNYINWDSYNLYGILYSTIMGIIYIRFSLNLNNRMKYVYKHYVLILVLLVAIPLFHNVVIEKSLMYSELWSAKNVLIIYSMFIIAVTLKLASHSRNFWNDVF